MSELPADARLGAIRLRAADVGLLRDFYERAIGLRALPSDDGISAVGAADGPLVELVGNPAHPSGRRGRRGCSTWRSSSRPGPTSPSRSAESSMRAGA